MITFSGLPSVGNPGPSPGGNGRGAANGAGGHHKAGGEYMGPVFIVRELNSDEGVYDAFITTGGIQEAKPPQASVKSSAAGQQQRPGGLQSSADEDPEYFGVLVTPETVRQLRIPKSVFVNASLSMLLSAASSKMPWLLVLRRSSYGELMLGDPQKRPSSPAPQTAAEPAAAADPTGGMLPGLMQVPQRRRYYNPDVRQRRAADFRFGRPLPGAADADAARIVPLMLERELLSTMCYNFARDNRQSPAMFASPRDGCDEDGSRGHRDARIDVDAYAAAAARFVPPSEEPESPQPETAALPMTVPKRVS